MRRANRARDFAKEPVSGAAAGKWLPVAGGNGGGGGGWRRTESTSGALARGTRKYGVNDIWMEAQREHTPATRLRATAPTTATTSTTNVPRLVFYRAASDLAFCARAVAYYGGGGGAAVGSLGDQFASERGRRISRSSTLEAVLLYKAGSE